MAVVDAYLGTLAPDQAAAFQHVRRLVLELVPDAGEVMTYGMPAFTYRDHPLLAFKAWTRHLGLYPCSSTAVDAVRAELDAGSVSKGGIRFTEAEPLPDDVVRRLLKARMAEIDARETAS